MNNQQLSVDISKTTPILNSNNGIIWQQGFLLRKVSRFITGGSGDALVPISVFYNPETGEICKDGLPQEVINLLENEEK